MNVNPFDQFDSVDLETPKPEEGYKYAQLGQRVAQTPGEVAGTAAIESRDRGANVQQLDNELARKGLTEKQIGPLAAERASLVGGLPEDKSLTNPFDQFDAAPTTAEPTSPKGFLETLRNPWQLITEESIPAHLKSAYDKGVFKKPLGELFESKVSEIQKDAENFNWSKLVSGIKENPGHFAGEFVNTVVADPELLLPFFWEALGGRLAVAGMQIAGKAGQVAGRVLETGLTGASVGGLQSAAEQLDKAGFVDPHQLAQSMGVGGAMGAALGGVMSIGGLMTKTKPSALADVMKTKVGEGIEPLEAAQKTLEEHGLDVDEAGKLVDAARPYRDEAAAEATAAQERIQSGEAKAYGEEPSALAARETQLRSKAKLTPSEAKELVDLRTYREVLPELGAAPEEVAAMTPSEAKAFVEQRLPDAPLDVMAKVEAPHIADGESPSMVLWKQRGALDPEMAKWAGLTLGGAALGSYLSDDKGKGGAMGAALALGGPVALKAMRGMRKAADEAITQGLEKFASFQRDPKIAKQIDDIMSAHEGMIATRGLQADRHAYAINKLVPNAERQKVLMTAIETKNLHGLLPNEKTAVIAHQEFVKEIGDRAMTKGLVDSLIDDGSYLSHIWQDAPKAKALFSAVSEDAKFAKRRFVPDYETGKKLGLIPKTENVGEIDQAYAQAMGRAEANQELLNTLKKVKLEGVGGYPVMPRIANKEKKITAAPADYVPLPHPQLQGMLVHPDMAPSLSHVFYATNIPAHMQAALAVSAAAKQGLLSLSGFHIKSLLEVGLGIGIGLGSPKTLTKIPAMVEMLRKGKAGDFVDQVMQAGLKVDAHGFDMDAGAWGKLTDKAIGMLEKVPLAGKAAALPIKGVAKTSEMLNNFLWQYLHPAIKLATANVAYTKALEREAGKLSADATYKAMSPQQILKEVASTTNDLFGGLNWRQVSGEIENRFMHRLVASRTNPEGLRGLRVGLLAPDWLVSTIRAGYKGIKATAKTFIPGTKISVADDLYRRYFLGGALMTGAVMEGLQQHFTGTHFWDNPDPTYVYLPDGRKIQIAKHFTEIFHWLREPAKTAINKVGYLPKEAMAQATGKEYVSAAGAPPMDTSAIGRVAHAGKGMLPISVQELIAGHPMEAVSGTLGAPIHGRSQLEVEEGVRLRQRKREETLRRTQRREKRR